ncbi:WGR domain-containing protein [Aliiroseovarius lamellibrachiae]|uniref:WGR domain-containing protein n=1 Tax=Aliiroseovarius lamellibrachiae TaxID=1924933 RepID=UPI001BDF7EDF|nr:WGR domain-containing protein [Aliiroseovarius lamellibrachiae]MBT2132655.1 WGR domain-containing protein [Aliiroseovarius lamellibrachiae]
MGKAQQHNVTSPQEELCLFRIDPDLSMHRYYCMALQKDLFGGTNLVREWGRIGRGGQVQISNHLSNEEAQDALMQMAELKKRRGYC